MNYYLPEVESRHKARGQGHKKIQGQGQPFRRQTLSRPRTQAQVFSKTKFFLGDLKKKSLKKILLELELCSKDF